MLREETDNNAREDESTNDENDEDWIDYQSSEEIDVPLRHTKEEIHAMIPEDIRTSIERAMNGKTYDPIRFVRTEQECQQINDIKSERIAHQLRGYNMDQCLDLTTHTQHSSLHNTKQLYHTLTRREQCGRSSKAQIVRLQELFMPFQEHKHCKVVDTVGERLYCGGFNSIGTRFLVAGQLPYILVYDTVDWERSALLPALQVQWTVTDAKFTPNDQNIIYTSINSNVRMVNVDFEKTQREHVFPLISSRRTSNDYPIRCGVWCLDINASGSEFVAGTSNNSVVLYDVNAQTTLCNVRGHNDDVNAIAFVDGPLHSNVFVSGSDDCIINLWDRRVLSQSNPKPQGVFPGHADGLTHISSRDDGYYFLSNSKDQTAKLWDLRKCYSFQGYRSLSKFKKPYHWDYRFQEYPGNGHLPVDHPHDRCVMTYRGHAVAETLIRCHFSPLHTTGQKYVYTGSADGRVYVFDTITGALVEVFAMKPDGLTRDVRWHPFEPTIASPDFYGKLCIWQRQR